MESLMKREWNEIKNLAGQWATDECFAEADRAEIASLLEENNEEELTERFYKDLEFGTGGLRGIIGVGANRINTYNIRRATHALGATIKAEFEGNTELSVAVSYDSRYKSQEFAKTACEVLAAFGIKSFIYDRLNPVPLLSYSLRYHKAQAGIMITASHNPKNIMAIKSIGRMVLRSHLPMTKKLFLRI